MLEIFDYEQGSPEWYQCRSGIITASSMHKVLAKGHGKTRLSYMYEMIGERVTGEPKEGFSSAHTERGHEQEPKARELYCIQSDCEVLSCGFMRNFHEIGYVGYSPDGLIGDNGLLEIKTKLPHLQAEILDRGEVPTEYKAQIQTGLWVSGREWIDFVSYSPFFPLFINRVYRDDKFMKVMEKEVVSFYSDLEEKFKSIIGHLD